MTTSKSRSSPSPFECAMDLAMDRYADGDLAAFEQLYRGYRSPLLRYLRRLVGDAIDTEDLLQITFLKVHRARLSWVRGSSSSAYLFAIAHNVAQDEVRSRCSRRRWLHSTTTADRPDPIACEDGGASLEQRLGIEAAVVSLPARYGQAFVLMHGLGMTVREAALHAGATVPAMTLRAHRARRRLRAYLSFSEPETAQRDLRRRAWRSPP